MFKLLVVGSPTEHWLLRIMKDDGIVGKHLECVRLSGNGRRFTGFYAALVRACACFLRSNALVVWEVVARQVVIPFRSGVRLGKQGGQRRAVVNSRIIRIVIRSEVGGQHIIGQRTDSTAPC